MNRIKVKIEIWENKDGLSPYIDSFKSIKDERTKDRIIKRNRFFEKLEFVQLMRNHDQMEKLKASTIRQMIESWKNNNK